MMKPFEYFNHMKSLRYTTAGDGVDYCIEKDDEGNLGVYFQESNGAVDWRTNLSFFPPARSHRDPTAKVYTSESITWHRGYYRAWQSAETSILLDITRAWDGKSKIKVIGWSYGGAMALLCAWAVERYLGTKCDVLTFGAPKIVRGYREHLVLMSKLGYVEQYANYNDIVTYVVPFKHWEHVFAFRVGDGRISLKKLLKPSLYHCMYGEEAIYKE